MNKVSLALIISFTLNLLLTCFKVLIGFIFKSSALIADGVHSFSDLSTDIVAFAGSKISRKPADKEHPFGHGKTEYLTSIVIGVVILLLGFTIIGNSNNTKAIPSMIVTIVTIFTITCKYLLSSYLINRGKKLNNAILISSGKESRADVISSVVVLISSILMQLSTTYKFLIYADSVATIVVGILIIRTGFLILKENISIILGKQEDDIDYINALKKVILKHDQVVKIDSLIIIKYGPYYSLNLEITMPSTLSLNKAHDIVHKVENKIKKYDKRIAFITTHINPM